METFEHFEEQERSWAHLDDLGEKLAKEAAELLAANPGATVAGLILEGRTPQSEGLWALVEHATGAPLTGPRCAGLIPGALAVEILRLNAGPGAVKWLEENTAPGRLPILVSMEHGFRMGVVEIPSSCD